MVKFSLLQSVSEDLRAKGASGVNSTSSPKAQEPGVPMVPGHKMDALPQLKKREETGLSSTFLFYSDPQHNG